MAEAHDRLGFVLGQLGRTDEALDEFRRAVEANPKLFDAQYHLGATLWWTKDPAGAVVALRSALALRPTHAEARYYLGAALRQTGELEPAVAALREAVRLNPRIVVAQQTLGVALQELGDAAGAVAALRKAVEMAPDAADARNSLGLALIYGVDFKNATATIDFNGDGVLSGSERNIERVGGGFPPTAIPFATQAANSGESSGAVTKSPAAPKIGRSVT